MESGLKPTNSRLPHLLIVLGVTILLGPTIGIFLLVIDFLWCRSRGGFVPRMEIPQFITVLGLAILFGPIGLFLFASEYRSLFDESTIFWLAYASIFGAIIYVPLGLLILATRLWLRPAGSWLIGIGLTVMLVKPAFILYNDPPGSITKIAYWQEPFFTPIFALGFVTVISGLWVRWRTLRPIPG